MGLPFVFKHFELEQEKAAFKLGTDSVVLGSWLPAKSYKRVLDIGAGTGVLSLMLAQRLEDAQILAVEFDVGSAEDCANNFAQSPWRDRLEIINNDVIEWSKVHSSEKFDLIISNPPYFNNSLQNPDQRKSTARHSILLTSQLLVEIVKQHLSLTGSFAFILPVQEFDEMRVRLEKENILAHHICSISSFENSEIIRKMGMFSFEKMELKLETQYLYTGDKNRSDWYNRISADFYIK